MASVTVQEHLDQMNVLLRMHDIDYRVHYEIKFEGPHTIYPYEFRKPGSDHASMYFISPEAVYFYIQKLSGMVQWYRDSDRPGRS